MQPENPADTMPQETTQSAEPSSQPVPDVASEPVDDELLLQWSIEDTASHHRPTTWYIIIAAIFAATIIVAIFTQTWIYIPLGILVPLALSIYVNKGIGDHTYALSTLTVAVDNKHYTYASYQSFFIVENKEFITFELVPVKRFENLLTLHTTVKEAEEVAEILSSVLPETEPKGYVGESVFKRLKF
ncbi:MAG: hypothetical protein U0526_03060 [Candidatus Saccharibacteria bacterium]